jgi:glycosyltransferase involved in cell wall biosynthesis
METPPVGYVLRMFPQASETFVANEVRELERLGLSIRIYSYRRPRETVRHEVVRALRAPITYLPDPLWRHPLALLRAHRALHRREPSRYRSVLRYVLRSFLRERDLDVWRRFTQAGYLATLIDRDGVTRLHAHFAHAATHVAMLTAMFLDLPFSFSAHARDIYTAKRSLLREKIAAARYVLTCTDANRAYLRELVDADQREKVLLAYHGVNVEKFSSAENAARAEPPLVLGVGRLVAKKGFPHLLRACRTLLGRGLSFRCVITGEGSERRRLEEQVRSLGLDGVVSLPGARTQEELVEEYRRATLLALPCRVLANGDRDGIPNVLVEAMAIGLPVVSTAISGIPELIESGENGLLVPERDDAALASAIELLLQDATLRARLARNARATVEQRFDSAANARRLADLLRSDGAAVAVEPQPAPVLRRAEER